jgi:uncharacterized membrane protein SpoIIM required for sporulation
MKQERFVALHETEWIEVETWLRGGGRKAWSSVLAERGVDFPTQYRRLCQHLALARSRGYSHEVTDRLQRIVETGHLRLYRAPAPRWSRIGRFIVADFPRLVRSEWRPMLIAALLLYVPTVACMLLLQWRPEFASSIFGGAQLDRFERMYDPANKALGRTDGTDVAMFGYYVMNNVGIAFRTFASGLLFGVGAVYVLVTNGVVMGGVAGHLNAIGYGHPFWRFVAAHASFELTAIVIAGGAGLRMGYTLLAPGRLRRGPALREAGLIGAQLALGAFLMLVVAAFIEAFWSSVAAFPDSVKFGSAALLWLLVIVWLGFGGRRATLGD